EIVEQGTAEDRKRRYTLTDRQSRVRGRVQVGFVDRNAVDEVVLVLLGGRDRRGGTVGDGRGNDQRVAPVQHDALASLRRRFPEFFVQLVEGEDDCLQRVSA